MRIISISLAIGCVLLLSSAFALSLFASDLTWQVKVVWGMGFAFALLWCAVNYRMLLNFFTKRSTRYGANLALVVFLVFGILAFVNIMAKDYKWRRDFSRSGTNTLSEQTLKILGGLERPVRAYYFGRMQEKEKGDSVLKNYVYNSRKFSYEFIDMNREPTRTESMGVKKADTTVLAVEGNDKKVLVDGVTEEKVTNGLVKLLKTKDQTVCYTLGHGERDFDSAIRSSDSYSMLKEDLEKQGYKVQPVNLMTSGKVGDSCTLLVIAGARTAFFPKELEILKGWLEKNKPTLAAFDLDVREGGLAKGSAQVASLLKPYGVEVMGQMLVDPMSKAANVEPQILLGFSASSEHPVTKDFPTSRLGIVANFYFPLTAYLNLDPQSKYKITALVRSSANAWAESDWKSLRAGVVRFDDGKDRKGPMDLGAAIEAKQDEEKKAEAPAGPRILVYGTSNFATNGVVGSAGNRDLFLNSVAWLSSEEAFISIRPKSDAENEQLNPNASLLALAFWCSVVIVPAFIIASGVFVWWRRKKL